jgi:hypothetical protein
MGRTIRWGVAALLLSGLLSNTSAPAEVGEVYICKGKYSKKYHLTAHCRGLSNCSTQVYKVSSEEARNLGRTLCGWED